MTDVKLSRIETVLTDLEYPASNDDAVQEFSETTLLLADGERNLGSLVERSETEQFESPEDLKTELHNVLPREAVGEPFQSEGEG
ncbi:hypothetical protein G6M89_12925 [Natronolimnobius sp. AArcel1]|uniref:DUF5789 family protein n=1 Tax=Natronolimnobius sp. AArcel1 TaxID=1679093 RepID=UPI0013EC09EF|nr:hypothetical protein [Natronolimnobius sp. AArcel1]NGM69902.1 hypothetical protein [Natronolimnobius sp. AArcel1]